MPPPLRTGTSPSPSFGNAYGRVRSASPARRALALDMRRMANLLRDPPLLGDASLNTSICSSPHSAMEPVERAMHAATGSTPVGSARLSVGMSRNAVQSQLTAMAEKINAAVSNLQWQGTEDRRRLTAMERKLDGMEERNAGGDSREKWADIQGSVNGLIEETQSLTRRVEGLDERLWARTSGAESFKQRSRELEQQVQALEHQVRLSVVATEEAQKRHLSKARRNEHAVEEAVRRLTRLEEQVRSSSAHQQQQQLAYNIESRLASMEQQFGQLNAEVGNLQLQVDEGLAAGAVGGYTPACNEGADELASGLEESLRATERSMAALDRRLTERVEETASALASMRVKVEGQLQRVGTLSERLETAHTHAVDALRSELTSRIAQDRREVESEVIVIRERVRELGESSDELRETVRHAQAEIAAFGLRQQHQHQHMPEEAQVLRMLEERSAMQERELVDLRVRLEESLAQLLDERGDDDGAGGATAAGDREMERTGIGGDDGGLGAGTAAAFREELDEALRAAERSVTQLDKRLTGQVEDLVSQQASLRVKVDGQLQRMNGLADRIEKAHEPAIEALRGEMSQSRTQDRRDLESQVQALQARIQELGEAREDREDGPAGLRDLLHQVRSEIEALSKSDESPFFRVIDERCGAQEEDLRELRERVDALLPTIMNSQAPRSPLAAAPTLTVQEPSAAAAAADAGTQKALAAAQQGLAALDKRLSAQVDEVTASVASLRVKVEGQGQRLGGLADRVESLRPEEAVDALRGEVTQGRQQDQRELRSEIEKLRSWATDQLEGSGSNGSPAPGGGAAAADDAALRALEGRVEAQEREVRDLGKRLDSLPPPTPSGASSAKDVADLEGRLAELEDRIGLPDEDLRKEMDELRAKLQLLDELQGRLEDVEDKCEARGEPANDMEGRLNELEGRLGKPDEELRKEFEGLKAKVEGLGGAAPQVAEPNHEELRKEIEDLKAQVEGLGAAVPQAAEPNDELQKELRKELAELKAKVEGLGAAAPQAAAPSDDLQKAVDELKSKLEDLEEGVKAADDLRTDLDDIKEQVKSIGSAKSTAVEGVTDEGLEELRQQLKDLHAQVKELESKPVPAASAPAAPADEELQDQIDELRRDVEDIAELKKQVAETAELKTLFSVTSTKLRELEGSFAAAVTSEALNDVKAAAEKAADSLREEVKALEASMTKRVEEAKGAGGGGGAGAAPSLPADLDARLAALEERGLGGGGGGGRADEQARAKVQEQVDDILKQVADELTSLSRHQQELVETKASVEALAAKVAAGAPPASAGAAPDALGLASVNDRLDAACKRLQSLEDSTGTFRKDLEQLQGPRKVGIGISISAESFSLADARDRINELREELTELQARGVSAIGGAGVPGRLSRGSEPEAELNFSLTEQQDDRRLGGGGRGGMDDSLGFSATESRKDFSLTDSVPILNAPPPRRGAAAGANSGAGAKDDADSDGSFDIEDAEVDLPETGGAKIGLGGGGAGTASGTAAPKAASAAPKKDARGGGGGDALDALVGVGGGRGEGRSEQRGPLARVDEESSDLGDQSAGSQSQSRGDRSGLAQSPANKSKSSAAPAMPESPHSVSGGFEHACEVSMSCNEVSYGGDYSVEDSCELDKCDHVEEVKPLGPLQKQVAASAAAGGKEGAAGPAPADAKPKAAAAGLSSTAASPSAGPAKSPTSAKDGEEGGDAYSDDYEESMAESIEENMSDSEA